jgi:hypothetical protein
MHFVSAGGLALSVGEIILKSVTALYHFCTINNILKKFLRFSFDSPLYITQLTPQVTTASGQYDV